MHEYVMNKYKADKGSPVYFDLVCWMKVACNPKNLMATYKMRTYFFCSDSCQKAFLLRPETYLEMGSRLGKGGWKLYWKRVKASVTVTYPIYPSKPRIRNGSNGRIGFPQTIRTRGKNARTVI
jgi:YHS domain-containing protein